MTLAGQAPRSRPQRQGRRAVGMPLALPLVLALVSGSLAPSALAGAAPRAGSALTPPANGAISCQAASTTFAMQECLGRQLRQADQDLERYVERAQRRLSAEQDLPAGTLAQALADLAESQRSWQLARDRYCQALWSFWSGGTVRGPMLLSCRIALARERQRRIWLDFLSFPDGSPPLLPEPPSAAPGPRP
jgi:uncharacterized protein YecT (DUF1311 family)